MEDNPPAFPQHPSQMIGSERTWGDPDMTLRDYFAGQALAGDLASQNDTTGEWSNESSDEFILNRTKFFYRFADAMLKARAGEGSV